MNITFVSEPSRTPPTSEVISPELLERFLTEVERRSGFQVSRLHGFLRDVAPPVGFVLLETSAHPKVVLDEVPSGQRSELASRLIPLVVGLTHDQIFDTLLESLSLPAVIHGESIRIWESREGVMLGAYGPHGRRDVSRLIDADCHRFGSARYCYLHSATHHGLPHLLVDYLRAVASMPAPLQ